MLQWKETKIAKLIIIKLNNLPDKLKCVNVCCLKLMCLGLIDSSVLIYQNQFRMMTLQWNSGYFSKYTDGYLLFVSMPCFGQSFLCDFMKMLGGLIPVVSCELWPKNFLGADLIILMVLFWLFRLFPWFFVRFLERLLSSI